MQDPLHVDLVWKATHGFGPLPYTCRVNPKIFLLKKEMDTSLPRRREEKEAICAQGQPTRGQSSTFPSNKWLCRSIRSSIPAFSASWVYWKQVEFITWYSCHIRMLKGIFQYSYPLVTVFWISWQWDSKTRCYEGKYEQTHNRNLWLVTLPTSRMLKPCRQVRSTAFWFLDSLQLPTALCRIRAIPIDVEKTQARQTVTLIGSSFCS